MVSLENSNNNAGYDVGEGESERHDDFSKELDGSFDLY